MAEAYWRFLFLSKPQRDAKSLAAALRRVPNAPETPTAQQFIERVGAHMAETETIRGSEREMNEQLYRLYDLSTDERLLVEKDCARRPLL